MAIKVLGLVACILLAGLISGDLNDLVSTLRLPPGFSVNIYTSVPYARSMSLSPSGVLYVASYNINDPDMLTPVYAVLPQNCTSVYCTSTAIAVTEALHMPNGVEFYNGDLYVVLNTNIMKYSNIEADLHHPPAGVKLLPDGILPDLVWHSWRYIRAGGDGLLYLTVGSPCNIPGDSDPECADLDLHPLYGSIVRVDTNGTFLGPILHGIRNSVGMTFHPQSGDLYFTDNGRDMWDPGHDQRPPDELNRWNEQQNMGQHYGFPYCYGFDLVDDHFNHQGNCNNYTGCTLELDPHAAALGVRFYYGSSFPSMFEGRVFIAEHGSWNRQPPSGYRVSVSNLLQGAQSYDTFLEGFSDQYMCTTDADCPGLALCQNDTTVYTAPFYCTGWGRPSDVQVLPDGSLAVTDDLNGVVYRISYTGSPWYLSPEFLAPVIIGAVIFFAVSGILMCRLILRRVRYPAVDGNQPILESEAETNYATTTATAKV